MLTDLRKINATAEVNLIWLHEAVREQYMRQTNKVCTNT